MNRLACEGQGRDGIATEPGAGRRAPRVASAPRRDWTTLNRRDFLAALGAVYGSAACALAAPRSWFLDYASGGSDEPVERFINTLCPMCPGGCGLTVRVVHGCAVGIRGNADHPINRGGLCSRASAVLQDAYNPDRLRHPVRRVGPRGSGQWEQIDWDTAIDTIADRLEAVRGDGDPQGLCVVMGRDRGLTRLAWRRFMRAFGSSNFVEAFPDDNLAPLPAILATHGIRQRIGYDLAGASYVLSFSSGWLDAHWSTEQAARAFAEFRRGRPGFRPKFVHIEPRSSLTAIKADEWVPIRPGTDGTLALGLAHVMIREGLYDRDFVARHGAGFDDWTDGDGVAHVGFRRMVLEDYTPRTVERVTGVPEGTVFRLARAFSRNRPAVALGYDGGACGTQSTYDRMAIHCINALGGSIDVPGGVTVFEDVAVLSEGDTGRRPDDGDTATGRAGDVGAGWPLAEHPVDRLAAAIESDRPAPTKALLLIDADPVFALAEGSRFRDALGSVPFVAAVSGYHDDTNHHADVILPSLHGLHRWDFNTGHTLSGCSVVTTAQPAMDPPAGTYDGYAVAKTLAKRLGPGVAEALPWSDSRAAVDAVCRELFDTGKGTAFGSANEERWARLLERRGWRAPFPTEFAAFKRAVVDGGGWTNPIYFHRAWDRVFRSPRGRFAFHSTYLADAFKAMSASGTSASSASDVAAAGARGEDAAGGARDGAVGADRRALPLCNTEGPKHDEAYPLHLYVYVLPNLVGVSSPNLPWLNDIAGAYMFEKWRTWVELHPETAERYGVAEDDRVTVVTSRGRLVLPVKVYPGLMPDVIAIPFGLGRNTGGRWCAGVGANPAELVDAATDPLTGNALWTATRAAIKPV
ncbi:MAG: molybdopterin-dependent oxidoreductase [Phycisphaerae bacterium]